MSAVSSVYRALCQVFRARTSPEAIDLVSRLLEYTPSARISPLQACAHSFFDELREAGTKLPNGRDLPQLFNFTEGELKIQPSLNSQLIPPHLAAAGAGVGADSGDGGAGAGPQAAAEPDKQVCAQYTRCVLVSIILFLHRMKR